MLNLNPEKDKPEVLKDIFLSDDEVESITQNIINKKWDHNCNSSPDYLEKNKIIVNHDLYHDLEVFTSYNHNQNDTIFNSINLTRTCLGQHYLKKILENPTVNTKNLVKRQHIIRNLINNQEKHQKVINLLNQLKLLQNKGLWIWKETTPELQEIYDIVYFKNQYLTRFNHSEWFLKIYNYFQIIFVPLYGILAPILMILIPYIITRFILGYKIPFMLYFNFAKNIFWGQDGIVSLLTGQGQNQNQSFLSKYGSKLYTVLSYLLYFWGIYNSLQASYNLKKIIDFIHTKVNNLARFIKTSYQLYQEVRTIFNLELIKMPYSELWSSVFDNEPSLLSDKGKILKTYYTILHNKEELEPLLQITGLIDAFNSISYLMVMNNYSFPKYLTNEQNKPILKGVDIWNPFLPVNQAIRNDINLGEKDNNMIITGANASGKSTYIKSVILNVLLAQTLGITASQELSITPFYLLNTYLNIPDVKGRESLFEAEMNRSKKHIDLVKSLKNNQYSLVVMDEIFNSTNYKEGVAGAYVIAKKLGNITNSLSIITTHFSYLTKLSETGKYSNYKFEVYKNGNKIIKTYRISPGVSEQYLALDLLEQNGYDKDMINEARIIFGKLSLGDKLDGSNQQESRKKKKYNTIPKSESNKLEIQAFKNRKQNSNQNSNCKDISKIGKNLGLECVIEKDEKKEEVLGKIQKAVEEEVSNHFLEKTNS